MYVRDLSDVNEWPDSMIWGEVFRGANHEARGFSHAFTADELAVICLRGDLPDWTCEMALSALEMLEEA